MTSLEEYRIAKMRHGYGTFGLLEAYGGRCICCGESDTAFLSPPPLLCDANNKGVELVAILRFGRRDLSGYRVLCFNCHMAYKNVARLSSPSSTPSRGHAGRA